MLNKLGLYLWDKFLSSLQSDWIQLPMVSPLNRNKEIQDEYRPFIQSYWSSSDLSSKVLRYCKLNIFPCISSSLKLTLKSVWYHLHRVSMSCPSGQIQCLWRKIFSFFLRWFVLNILPIGLGSKQLFWCYFYWACFAYRRFAYSCN